VAKAKEVEGYNLRRRALDQNDAKIIENDKILMKF